MRTYISYSLFYSGGGGEGGIRRENEKDGVEIDSKCEPTHAIECVCVLAQNNHVLALFLIIWDDLGWD
jgi:hypothetical protein